ncbi:hypothetical protein LXL04_003408 [Taraxacum kok-saghyz]
MSVKPRSWMRHSFSLSKANILGKSTAHLLFSTDFQLLLHTSKDNGSSPHLQLGSFLFAPSRTRELQTLSPTTSHQRLQPFTVPATPTCFTDTSFPTLRCFRRRCFTDSDHLPATPTCFTDIFRRHRPASPTHLLLQQLRDAASDPPTGMFPNSNFTAKIASSPVQRSFECIVAVSPANWWFSFQILIICIWIFADYC